MTASGRSITSRRRLGRGRDGRARSINRRTGLSDRPTTRTETRRRCQYWTVVSKDYYPYGDEIGGSTAGNADKFGTYHRDATSGLDYADQRYYSGLQGRFLTSDPYEASGGAGEPASWGRYGYVLGDPVNWFDPRGTTTCDPNPPYNCTDSIAVSPAPSPRPGGGGGGGGGTPVDVSLGANLRNAAFRVATANALQGLVSQGTMNDCEAMSHYASAMASEWIGSEMPLEDLVQSFDVLIRYTGPGATGVGNAIFPNTALGNIGSNETGQGSGFKVEFQDSNYPNGDQAHHFVFLFMIGANFPNLTADGLTSTVLAYLPEILDKDHWSNLGSNQGDVRLANKAMALGNQLARGEIQPSQLGPAFFNALCSTRGKVAPK